MLIGVQLGIDQGTLDAIEKDYRHASDCLRRLISHWLNNVDPRPTRSAINKAIQSDCVRGKILIYYNNFYYEHLALRLGIMVEWKSIISFSFT